MRSAVAHRVEWAMPAIALVVGISILRLPAGGAAPMWVAGWAIAALVTWICCQDLASFTISDAALLAMAVVAASYRVSAAVSEGQTAGHVLAAASTDVLLCAGALLAVRELHFRLRGYDGLGFGDVKLAAVGALLVGGIGFSWALAVASAAGLGAVSMLRLIRPRQAPSDRLAFGAVLAPALWAVWLAEQTLPRLFAG